MPFTKGESGNPEGRPKGTPNKITQEGRELFIKIMDGQVEHIEDELALLREQSGKIPKGFSVTIPVLYA